MSLILEIHLGRDPLVPAWPVAVCKLSHTLTNSAGAILGNGSLEELVSQPEQRVFKSQLHRYIIREEKGEIRDTLMCSRLGSS